MNPKLFTRDVRHIIVLRARGRQMIDLASQYDVDVSLVSRLTRGIARPEVTQPIIRRVCKVLGRQHLGRQMAWMNKEPNGRKRYYQLKKLHRDRTFAKRNEKYRQRA